MIRLGDILFLNYRYLRKKVFKRYLVRFLSFLILIYRNHFSNHTCMYNPTCSQYMLTSLNRYGFPIGLLLGLLRILRCNPFTRGGYDPVPENYFVFRWVM